MKRKFFPLHIKDITSFKRKLLLMSEKYSNFCFLESNDYQNYPYSTFGTLIGIDSISEINLEKDGDSLAQLQQYIDESDDWLLGYLNYDLKNEIHYNTEYPNNNLWNALHFFSPRWLIKIDKNEIYLGVIEEDEVLEFNNNFELLQEIDYENSFELSASINKEDYISEIERIKEKISRGDIYEVNYCMSWIGSGKIDIVKAFIELNELSEAPFTCFLRHQDNFLICASPERYLKKSGNKLIAQPIKGTKKREKLQEKDLAIQTQLFTEEKERAENIMIVDLVRNDLSQIANKKSVNVEELCKVYTFKQVHQMISTITAELDSNTKFVDIIKATFPMGSMTGAPKLNAMQIIDTFEHQNRDLFSGAVGYITPKGNFDFNVVIRSLFYNQDLELLKIIAGSAITYESDAGMEYQECLLKAEALLQILKT